MKINQLFREIVPDDLYKRILHAFGISSNDYYSKTISFSKNDLEKIGTLEYMKIYTQELRSFYIPCKADIYLHDITLSKCITILRQIVRLYGKVLLSSQKYIQNKKITVYTLRDNTESQKKMYLKHHPVRIEFL